MRIANLTIIAVIFLAFQSEAKSIKIAEEAYKLVNLSIVKTHIRPRYVNFAIAGSNFHNHITKLCTDGSSGQLELSRTAFKTMVGAWMGIGHIQDGPVKLYMRQVRVQFWPDKRGRTGKQLRAFLEAADASVLGPKKFPRISIALQGFGVAERLLFMPRHSNHIIESPKGLRCKLLRAVANSLAQIGAQIVQEWGSGEGSFATEMRDAGQSLSRFNSHREVTVMLVNGLFTSLKFITDFKLDRILGKTIAKARPKRAESWLCGRSRQNIIDNLTALQALYKGENGGQGLEVLIPRDNERLGKLLTIAFDKTLRTARRHGMPLVRGVSDRTSRETLLILARQTRALKALVARELAPVLGTPLGFNALDGD